LGTNERAHSAVSAPVGDVLVANFGMLPSGSQHHNGNCI
jgi:hypothetical protein